MKRGRVILYVLGLGRKYAHDEIRAEVDGRLYFLNGYKKRNWLRGIRTNSFSSEFHGIRCVAGVYLGETDTQIYRLTETVRSRPGFEEMQVRQAPFAGVYNSTMRQIRQSLPVVTSSRFNADYQKALDEILGV